MRERADTESAELKRLGLDPATWAWFQAGYSGYGKTDRLAAFDGKTKLFSRKHLEYSPDRAVYGFQPTPWGRGAGESITSTIWTVGFLLNKLTKIPNVTVFHGLKVPGSGSMVDVEHAVSVGNTVYLVDSEMSGFMNREIGWHENKRGKEIATKGEDGWRHTRLADVSEYYRKQLGPQCTVIPIITMTSRDAAITGERWSRRGVGLFTATELLNFIGDAAVDLLPEAPAPSEGIAEILLRTVRG